MVPETALEGLDEREAEQIERLEAERQARAAKKAADLGVPGNTTLALYVLDLEFRLKQIERTLERLGMQ
jgi:hypothetical protein